MRGASAAAVVVAFAGCAQPTPDPTSPLPPSKDVTGFVDDASITSGIRAALAADAALDAPGIKVETDHGTVVLSGTAKTTLEKTNAENIAVGTRGVKLVRNEIAVKP